MSPASTEFQPSTVYWIAPNTLPTVLPFQAEFVREWALHNTRVFIFRRKSDGSRFILSEHEAFSTVFWDNAQN